MEPGLDFIAGASVGERSWQVRVSGRGGVARTGVARENRPKEVPTILDDLKFCRCLV